MKNFNDEDEYGLVAALNGVRRTLHRTRITLQ